MKIKTKIKTKKIPALKMKKAVKTRIKKNIESPPIRKTESENSGKRLGKKVSKALLFLLLGIMISFTLISARAALILTRSDGTPLTSAIWNEMVNRVNVIGDTITEGKWCSISGGRINCNNDRPVMTEDDPQVLSLGANNSWCTSDGAGHINCLRAEPLTSESDPEVGTLGGNGQWCTSSGTQVNCTTNPPIGTQTAGKWCTTNGSQVSCTTDVPVGTVQDAKFCMGGSDGKVYCTSNKPITDWSELTNIPAGFADGADNATDARVTTLTAGKWCTSNGTSLSCTTDPPISAQTAGKWCTSNGTTVSCSADGDVGTVEDAKWCVGGNDGKVYCINDKPITDWSELTNIPADIADGDNATDARVTTLTAGKWCTSDGTSLNCITDPPINSQSAGKWCTSDGTGTKVNCTTDVPVGTVVDAQWCVGGNDGKVYCNRSKPITDWNEMTNVPADIKDGDNATDARIGTLQNGQWCTSNGVTVSCTSTLPLGTQNAGKWCTSDGTTISCTDNPPISTQANGKWCTSDGIQISCTTDVPVATVVEAKYCIGGNDGKIYCNTNKPITDWGEMTNIPAGFADNVDNTNDSRISTMTNNKWCYSNGTDVICTKNDPTDCSACGGTCGALSNLQDCSTGFRVYTAQTCLPNGWSGKVRGVFQTGFLPEGEAC